MMEMVNYFMSVLSVIDGTNIVIILEDMLLSAQASLRQLMLANGREIPKVVTFVLWKDVKTKIKAGPLLLAYGSTLMQIMQPMKISSFTVNTVHQGFQIKIYLTTIARPN